MLDKNILLVGCLTGPITCVPFVFYIFIFIIGSIVGSFLNVCIYRLPKNESIVLPRSYCPNCKKNIPWFDNIPLLSFIILKAKCRFCAKHISFRYFIVELITALLFLFLFIFFGPTIKFLIFASLSSVLIIASFIDIEYQIIPDEITLGGLLIGILLSIVYPGLHDMYSIKYSLMSSLKGVLVGGGSIFLIGFIGKLIFKKEAMGGGDVKFMAMIGSILGWKKVLLTFFIAPFFGSIIGIIVLLKNKEHLIPYGPFLSLAALVSIFYGDKILRVFIF